MVVLCFVNGYMRIIMKTKKWLLVMHNLVNFNIYNNNNNNKSLETNF